MTYLIKYLIGSSEDTYSFSDPKFVGDFIAVEIKKTHSIVSNDWNLQWVRILFINLFA